MAERRSSSGTEYQTVCLWTFWPRICQCVYVVVLPRCLRAQIAVLYTALAAAQRISGPLIAGLTGPPLESRLITNLSLLVFHWTSVDVCAWLRAASLSICFSTSNILHLPASYTNTVSFYITAGVLNLAKRISMCVCKLRIIKSVPCSVMIW